MTSSTATAAADIANQAASERLNNLLGVRAAATGTEKIAAVAAVSHAAITALVWVMEQLHWDEVSLDNEEHTFLTGATVADGKVLDFSDLDDATTGEIVDEMAAIIGNCPIALFPDTDDGRNATVTIGEARAYLATLA